MMCSRKIVTCVVCKLALLEVRGTSRSGYSNCKHSRDDDDDDDKDDDVYDDDVYDSDVYDEYDDHGGHRDDAYDDLF